MFEKIKPYVNRYFLIGMFVYGLILGMCNISQAAALVLGPLAVGGIWLGWKGYAKPARPCVCGGKPTTFAGHCPCGGRIEPKPAAQKTHICPDEKCKRPGGVVSEKLVNDQGGNQVIHRHYACSGGHSWDAFSSQS